jgi:hypothetical protein
MSMDEEQPKLAFAVGADAMWFDSVTKRRAPTITLKTTRYLATQSCVVCTHALPSYHISHAYTITIPIID